MLDALSTILLNLPNGSLPVLSPPSANLNIHWTSFPPKRGANSRSETASSSPQNHPSPKLSFTKLSASNASTAGAILVSQAKCVRASRLSSSIVHSLFRTKCMGCMANITAKAKDGRLVIARARLRHNHALFPHSPVPDHEQNYSSDIPHFKYEEGDDGDYAEEAHEHDDPTLVDRMEVADSLLQRLRDRALSKTDPKWFSGFVELLVDVDRITSDPGFPSPRENLVAARWGRSFPHPPPSSTATTDYSLKRERAVQFVGAKRTSAAVEEGEDEESTTIDDAVDGYAS